VTLGRSGIVATRLGLGFAAWPFQVPYAQVVDVLKVAFAAGIRYVDTAALYCTEELLGRALQDARAPPDLVISTKACAYKDEIGIDYREYSAGGVYLSVERSLRSLQADCLDTVHIHDPEPEDLARVFARDGALRALLDLKSQGVIRSVGMATVHLECLQAAMECGDLDHIQFYHSFTLLNQDARSDLIPRARAKSLSILNSAPQAGFILATSTVPGATYNYRPASQAVVEAVQRLERICAVKEVSLATAALAFSLLDDEIDVTVVGARSPERVRDCVRAFGAPLTKADFAEMVAAAGGPYPLRGPYKANPAYTGPWPNA
jgi:D-threo-aldose 1-dehydrogenase